MVIFLAVFVIVVLAGLWFALYPLTPYAEKRKARRKELARARRIYGFDLSDEERAARFRRARER